jgi:hypothetical protein
MNKAIIFLMVLSLIMGVMVPFVAYGEENADILESLVTRAKTLFNIPDGYDTFNSSVSSYGGRTHYYLNWRDSVGILDEVSVSIDSEGFVNSYSTYSPYSSLETRLPKIGLDSAKTLALEFMGRLDPDMPSKLEYDSSSYWPNAQDPGYSLRFRRIENSIPFEENDVNITVSKETGKITNYFANWLRTAKLDLPNGILDSEAARKAFIAKIGLQLVYKPSNQFPRPIGSTGSETDYFLAYSPVRDLRMVDAWTGEPVETVYVPYGLGSGKEEAMDQMGVTPIEQQELDKLKGLLSGAAAESIAVAFLKLDSSYEMENQSLYGSWRNKDEYQWSMRFSLKGEEPIDKSADIAIDAKSGEILSFYIAYNIEDAGKPTMDRNDALVIASEYVEKMVPEIFKNLKLREQANPPELERVQFFDFERYLNGILVEGDSIGISVDLHDGSIISYNKNWYNGVFPSSAGVISADRAYQVLFDTIGFELGYKLIPTQKESSWSDEVKLVYMINPQKSAIIDAFTGEHLDYSGKPYQSRSTYEYNDIDGSYAKDKIAVLAEYGITGDTGKFRPKDLILQKEYLSLLWKAMNPYRAEYEPSEDEIYNQLLSQRIVQSDEINRDSVISKAQAAKFGVRAKGLAKVAEIPGIYADLFSDSSRIPGGLKGYVTLAYGMGLLKGDNTGAIKPDYILKREDAASIIYNYVFN